MNVFLFVLTACIHYSCATSRVDVSGNVAEKGKNCSLDTYRSENDVHREYDMVASINSKTGTTIFSRKSIAKAVDLAKTKACKYGADAVIVVDSSKKGINFWNYGHARASVKAIRYK